MRLSSKSITILLLSLLPFIYFYPAVLGDITLLPGDGWLQNLGVRLFIGEQLRRGELALWNPYIFAGMPLLASVYPGALYPPNWLFAVFAPKLAANLVVITTFHVALIGTYLFARRSGSNRLGAVLAGTAFSFGGFMVNHISQTSRIAAAAWLPWVLLALAGCVEAVTLESKRRVWLWVTLSALFIALQFFAGEPQMLIFTALVCALYCLFALAQLRGWRQRGFFAAACLTLVIVGVLLAQMQLQPSLELLATSERNDPGALFFAGYSYPPWQLPALIFPYFFGGAFFGPYHTEYWGRDIAGIMCGYVGLATWLLASVAVLRGRREGRVWLWVTVAVVAVVLSFGGYLPFGLNELLYRVPGYKTFRGLYRHQYELTFALAMLAALGATKLAELESAAKRQTARMTIILTSVIVLFVAVLFRFFAHKLASAPLPPNANALTNPEALVPLLFFAVSALAVWFYAANPSAFRLPPSAFLLVVLLLDLASYGHFFHWKTGKFDVAQRLSDPPAVQAIKQRELNLDNFRIAHLMMLPYDYTADWPGDDTFDALDYPNTSMARGLQSVAGYDILRPIRIGEMTGTANSAIAGFLQDSNSFTAADRGFDLLNVKYILTERYIPNPSWQQIYRDQAIGVYENKEVMARAFIVPEAKVAPTDQQPLLQTDLHKTVFIEDSPTEEHATQQPHGRRGRLLAATQISIRRTIFALNLVQKLMHLGRRLRRYSQIGRSGTLERHDLPSGDRRVAGLAGRGVDGGPPVAHGGGGLHGDHVPPQQRPGGSVAAGVAGAVQHGRGADRRVRVVPPRRGRPDGNGAGRDGARIARGDGPDPAGRGGGRGGGGSRVPGGVGGRLQRGRADGVVGP